MANENPTDAPPAGGAPSTESAAPSPPLDVAALVARLAAYEAKDVEATSAQRAAQAALEAELAAKGEHAKLAEALSAKLAALEPDAAVGRAYRERETAKIADAAKGLAAEDRAILDALPSLDSKAAFLARISAVPKSATAPPGASGGPPSSTASLVDFDKAWATPEWPAAKAKDPKGAAAWLEKAMNGNAQTSTLSRMFSAKAPNVKA